LPDRSQHGWLWCRVMMGYANTREFLSDGKV
jgi:hypothetical protein